MSALSRVIWAAPGFGVWPVQMTLPDDGRGCTSPLPSDNVKLTPDWVEAIATCIAAVGTVGTLFWQARALRQERETRRSEVKRLEADQRANQDAQARTIVAYPSLAESISVDCSNGSVTVRVVNYGVHPVINLTGLATNILTGASVSVDKFSSGGNILNDIPENTRAAADDHRQDTLQVLDAGAFIEMNFRLQEMPKFGFPGTSHYERLQSLAQAMRVEIQFTDLHGIRWALRAGLGQQPTRITP